MKAWSTWFPDLLPHVKGCPIPIAEFELRRAAQAFFKLSRAWKVTQPTVPIAANQQSVTVTPADTQQEMVRVEKAWLDGKSLDVVTAEDMDDLYSDDWTIHTGVPCKVVQLTPGVVTLYPIPVSAAATGLKLRISVRPSEASEGLPDDMAVKFRDEITAGAKARLMLYPDEAWSNSQLAVVNAGAFDAGSSKANLAAALSYGQGRIASRPKWA